VPSEISELNYGGLTGEGPDISPISINVRPDDPESTGEIVYT
jgi:hypothetical protein